MSLWSRLRWPKRLFLCFHAVDGTWLDPGLSVAPEVFGFLIASLAAAGYRGETFSSVVAATGSDRLVAVTFDDAYTSVATQAAPILDDVGWPASVFVPTAPIFDGGSMYWIGAGVRDRHPTATSQLTPEQIRDLASRGWEVGSHSRTHRLLSRLTPAELDDELARSRDEVVSLTGSCAAIAYPWGEVDSRVVDAARRAGYLTGSGLSGRFTWSDPLRTPRVAIHGVDGRLRFALKTSQAMWALRATPLWSILEDLRGLSGARDQGRLPLRSRIRGLRPFRRGDKIRADLRHGSGFVFGVVVLCACGCAWKYNSRRRRSETCV